MTIEKFLDKAKKFELEAYKRIPDLTRNHVAFSGAPQKHPHDEKKIILIVDPFSTQPFYYQFDMADIEGVEVLPSLATAQGDTVTMARVWVKKGSLGVKAFPFVVADTSEGQRKPAPVD
jgi:hypothetical protein